MYPTRPSGFFIVPIDTVFYWQSAVRCTTRPADDICRSYLCVIDTTSEILSPRRCFGWLRKNVSYLAFCLGKFARKFLYVDPKGRSQRIHRVHDQHSLWKLPPSVYS